MKDFSKDLFFALWVKRMERDSLHEIFGNDIGDMLMIQELLLPFVKEK